MPIAIDPALFRKLAVFDMIFTVQSLALEFERMFCSLNNHAIGIYARQHPAHEWL